MQVSRKRLAAGIAVAGVLVATGAAAATDDHRQGGRNDTARFRAVLTGYEEVGPNNIAAVSTTGSGGFRAALSRDGRSLTWVLTYSRLEGAVQQAHIHFGQRSQAGGISAFLCTNQGNSPQPSQPCPQPQGTATAIVRGTITAADVIGPAGQGIEPGAFHELVAAMLAGTTYANVHTGKWPSGEIRGQLDARGRW